MCPAGDFLTKGLPLASILQEETAAREGSSTNQVTQHCDGAGHLDQSGVLDTKWSPGLHLIPSCFQAVCWGLGGAPTRLTIPRCASQGQQPTEGGPLESVCLQFSSPLNPHFSLAHTSRCAALLLIANTQKQPKCPSADEGTRNTWHIHTVDYYLAMIKDEIMQLEMITLSAGSQKNKFHMTDLRVESKIQPK